MLESEIEQLPGEIQRGIFEGVEKLLHFGCMFKFMMPNIVFVEYVCRLVRGRSSKHIEVCGGLGGHIFNHD